MNICHPSSTPTIDGLMETTLPPNSSSKEEHKPVPIISIKSTGPTAEPSSPCILSFSSRYDDTVQQVKEPTLSGFLKDNIWRLLLNRNHIINKQWKG